MNPRVAWHDLPRGLRVAIEDAAGKFVHEEPVGTGHNCLLAMVLTTHLGSFFLKGVPADHKRAVWSQANEADTARYVRGVSPACLFHLEQDGWDVLGFEYLEGAQHADLGPGSPDLPLVMSTLAVLSGTLAMNPAFKRIEDRWSEYAGAGASLLAGDCLAHTDLHRHNLQISRQRAYVVDWAWPTHAAPWIDTACVGLQMIEAGHAPKEAELWCEQLPAYAAAGNDAVSIFVKAARGLWRDISNADPQPWKINVWAAAQQWAEYRGC